MERVKAILGAMGQDRFGDLTKEVLLQAHQKSNQELHRHGISRSELNQAISRFAGFSHYVIKRKRNLLKVLS